MVQCWI